MRRSVRPGIVVTLALSAISAMPGVVSADSVATSEPSYSPYAGRDYRPATPL